MAFIDLHAHTTGSDGTMTGAELVRHAAEIGLRSVAITDHDTTVSIPEAVAEGLALGIEVVPGIEVSCSPRPLRRSEAATLPDGSLRRWGTLHILGLFVRHDAAGLLDIRTAVLILRGGRNPQIVAKLQTLGIDLDYSQVVAIANRTGTKIVGRPHIAQALVEIGAVKDISEAFHKYIGEGRPCFVRRDLISPAEAIAAIHDAGGVASLAHPIQLRPDDDDELDLMIGRLADAGLDAVEVLHPDHDAAYAQKLDRLTAKHNLLRTGGSDFHGSRKAVKLGAQHVPAAWLDTLKNSASERADQARSLT